MKFDLLILSKLMERPLYGYELKKVIETTLITCDSTGGGFSSSMIYPSLARFEKAGIVVKQVQIQEGRPNRNIYEMTEEGKKYFYKFVNTITPKIIHDREMFYYRLGCFAYLTEKNRKKLLSGRQAYLEQAVAFIREHSCDERNFCQMNLQEFTMALGELELRHIAFFTAHIGDPCLVPNEEQQRIDGDDE